MNKYKVDILFSLILILICLLLYINTSTFPVYFKKVGYGPGFYPNILLISLILFSTILIIQSLLHLHKGYKEEKSVFLTIKNYKPLFILIIVYFIYILFLSKLGFFVSSLLFLVISMFFLKLNFYKSILIALLLVSVIYYVFTGILKVPLAHLGFF